MSKTKTEVIIQQSFVGLLYEDGAFKAVLPPGKAQLKRGWFDDVVRTVTLVDMRERSLTIKGQEILTADKVAIRVSLLVYFKITDAPAAVHNVASYEERIYEDVQLAARRFLASRSLEAILSDRNEISDAVRDDVKGTAARYGVEIVRADVKDLVFPGNLREIMNQVLETERRAEAKVIQARKDAEALHIQAEAENERARQKIEATTQQTRLMAEAEKERLQLKLTAQIEEARAVADNPALLKLRELEALGEMAKAGGKFVVGLKPEGMLGDGGERKS
ncbi:slipin family protein [Sorangium sp. So ce363]|uniref:slipin family protein n=1 Tax=Sorangium sp. So ce363 TaxID=3133304 RepID=UPI003F5DBC5D